MHRFSLDPGCYDRITSNKIFFKDSVDVVVYIFYMQLCFSLSTLFFSKSEFSYHSSLRLCTTKVFFSIESIKSSSELSNQT